MASNSSWMGSPIDRMLVTVFSSAGTCWSSMLLAADEPITGMSVVCA